VADKMLRPDMSPAERKAIGTHVNDLAQRTTFGPRGEVFANSAASALVSPRSIASIPVRTPNPESIVIVTLAGIPSCLFCSMMFWMPRGTP